MRHYFFLFPLLLAGCVSPTSQLDRACNLSAEDRAWLDASVAGWIATRDLILEATTPTAQEAIIFDTGCKLQSETAMLIGQSEWQSTSIAGDVIQIGDQPIPIGVVSATVGHETGTRFVMSTPSVWADGGVASNEIALENLMSAVFMHEATHVFQMDTFGSDIGNLQLEQGLTDEQFNDDAIQARFADQSDFAASVEQETALLFAAAEAENGAEAVRLARAARDLMRARAARYFVGDQAYQERAEDLWLTMEGSAQWAGLRWLQLPTEQGGGGLSKSAAMLGFGRRGGSWTQSLGLAMTLAVDRLAAPSWKEHIFGDGNRTLIQILDESIEENQLSEQ